MKKPIREFIRYSQWKIPEVNCGIASMCFVLKKQQKYSIIFLLLTWLKPVSYTHLTLPTIRLV